MADVSETVTWATRYGVTYPIVRVTRRSESPAADSDAEAVTLDGRRSRGEVTGLKIVGTREQRICRYAEPRPLGAGGRIVTAVVIEEFRPLVDGVRSVRR